MSQSRTHPDFKPIYQVIKDDILADIRNGRLKPHDPLESRHELIKRYGCSWATVHRAISELILEGVLYARQGKGTFAASRSIESVQVLSLHPIPSWHHSLVEMMEGMRDETFRSAIGLTMINLPHQAPEEYDLDGHIVLTPAVDDRQKLLEAKRRGARFVVLGSDYPDSPALPCVNADTRSAVAEAVSRLIAAGHRHIGLIGVMESFPNYQREIDGYMSALRSANLPILPEYILPHSHPERAFDARITEWLKSHPEVTAIFAADYSTSLTFLQVARANGIDVPNDLSLICMDKLPAADLLSVPPVSVVQPFREMGRVAIRRLVAAMRGETELAGTELLPCTLIDGDSVRPLSTTGSHPDRQCS